ncbi:MAG TPA: metallophosphoesterase [Candidatus Binataceae bacterium]|nr:metallophosphoesterase [Candidatus Binataceae bacterium]
MSTKLKLVADGQKRRRREPGAVPPRKPPIPLRPLHRMWRKTIDGIEVAATNLPVRQLPPGLTGLVACQISDLHVDRDEDLARLEAAVKAINRQQPDLVFLTGDYFSGGDTMRRYADGFRRALASLNPRVGLFAILGNHDHWASASVVGDALKRAGARLLANEHQRVVIRGDHLVVVGIDDLWARKAEPTRAFRGLAPDECTIVLAHNPDTALYARHLAPGVMLSGHTHGGVVRIPYYGSPIRSILRIGKKFYAGLNRYNEFYIYTNRGLGTFWLRIRINCRPEVSRFSLAMLEEGAGSEAAAIEPPRRPRRARASA